MSKHDLPANVTAEKNLLGCLIAKPDQYWVVHDRIRADHFVRPLHRLIFVAIQDVNTEGKKISLAILESRLPEEDEATGQSMIAILTALAHNATEAGLNADDFADEVAESAGRRQLIKLSEAVLVAARKGEKHVIDIASEAEERILDVLQTTSPKRARRLDEIAASVFGIAKVANKGGRLPGLSTGLGSVDEITGLWMPGDLVFLLGSQGDGKSSLAAQIGVYNAKQRPVLMLQNEMTEEQTAARQVAIESGVPVRDIREGAFDLYQKHEIEKAIERLKEPEFWVLNDPRLTVRRIKSHALALKRTVGLGFLIVDQLTHVRSENRHRDKWSRLEEVTSDFKSLALELECPVLVLCQRTRTAQRRDDPEPHIDDADAPSIERDGDIVFAVWREESWLRRNKPNKGAGEEQLTAWKTKIHVASGKAGVIGLKIRSGPAFESRQLKWIGNTTSFEELGK